MWCFSIQSLLLLSFSFSSITLDTDEGRIDLFQDGVQLGLSEIRQ